ncbi:hypothetical protein K435DRAFT_961033 [Dendrothele bispora CBS 962.96]|uniref:Uncharacterized protein n=1 Tax=Dendrothele bispora (strain CBS 962.96) TaxID=1314807 RepID=A0A4S8MR22_DENBC|nr:hypothetical protein K435DRAFT_961033 [Dendrothele bispora CBS 962.96]
MRPASPYSDFQTTTMLPPTRPSYARRVERRLVQAWKSVTHATRKSERASFVPPGFILVTKRRSIRYM